ncbi:MAG TPA: YetF domain-containing protein [Bryobacteraceae bacterium]|nr:YetF domain-containing protein [Bryobacteraceae bacterium]
MPQWLFSHDVWLSIFGVGAPVVEKVLRPVIVYFFLVLLLRVFGKRELAQLNPFDLVVLLSLSNTVQNAIIGNDNSLTGGLIGAFTLLAVNYLVVRFLFKHRRLDEILEGRPTVLVENGEIVEKALAREMLSRSELITVLHRQSFSGLDEVDKCVLEPGGVFYVSRKVPPVEETQFQEIVRRMEELDSKLERLLKRAEG